MCLVVCIQAVAYWSYHNNQTVGAFHPHKYSIQLANNDICACQCLLWYACIGSYHNNEYAGTVMWLTWKWVLMQLKIISDQLLKYQLY